MQVNTELAESEPEPQAEPSDPRELEDEAMAATLRAFAEPQKEATDAT